MGQRLNDRNLSSSFSMLLLPYRSKDGLASSMLSEEGWRGMLQEPLVASALTCAVDSPWHRPTPQLLAPSISAQVADKPDHYFVRPTHDELFQIASMLHIRFQLITQDFSAAYSYQPANSRMARNLSPIKTRWSVIQTARQRTSIPQQV